MGNLLGSPITEKDTHTGTTHDSNTDRTTSSDGGGLQYGISSMQGWRVHMEDAHICQPFLYAEKQFVDNYDGNIIATESTDADRHTRITKATPSKRTAIETTLSNEEGVVDNKTEVKVNVTDKEVESSDKKYIQIPLLNHALFAVFDGHGGSFAAEYASRNLLRLLCRSAGFIEYAEKWRGRDAYLASLRNKLSLEDGGKRKKVDNVAAPNRMSGSEETPEKEELDDKQRLQMLKKRGLESDEKVKQIKEQVRKHFDGEKVDVTNVNKSSTSSSSEFDTDCTEYQYAQATYDHELMTLLEHSLRDAFIDIDAEILREVRGEKVTDANLPYGVGYDLSMHSLEGCIGHLPKEATNSSSISAVIGGDKVGGGVDPANTSNDHPTPSDDEDAGTTACVVVTTPKWIVCANAGDSRAVYSRSNHRAVPLSYDHKPEDEDEERRIREAGGYVSGGRVEGDLAVSRGLGDYRFKDLDAVMSGSMGESVRRGTSILQRQITNTLQQQQQGEMKDNDDDVPMLRPSEQKVSPVPDIIIQNRDSKEDEFIILCCDGIWDVQTNQECVRMVADIFDEGECDLGLVCEEVRKD